MCPKLSFLIFVLSKPSKLSSLWSHCFSGFFVFGSDGILGTPQNKTFGLESLELIWMVFSELVPEPGGDGGFGGGVEIEADEQLVGGVKSSDGLFLGVEVLDDGEASEDELSRSTRSI